MHLRVTHKLFLLMLLLVGTAVGTLGTLTALNLRHGFVGYINLMDFQHLQPLAKALIKHVESGGRLADFASRNRWQTLLQRTLPTPAPPVLPDSTWSSKGLGLQPLRPRPNDRLSASAPPIPPPPPPPPGPPAKPLWSRVTLLDAERHRVAGTPVEAHALERALDVNGRTVGWLALTPLHRPSDRRDAAFLHAQLRNLAWTAALLLVLTLLVTMGFARHLLAPLRRITEATARLAEGRFDVHMTSRRHDELGDLIRHINDVSRALERHEGARRRWMADISHELRTPLSILRGEVEAMLDGVADTSPAAIASLHEETMRLQRLVDDLHDLAMSDLGALSYHCRICDMRALVASAAGRFRTRMQEAGLTLQVALPERSCPVFVDPDRLGQLLDNVLENSQRYTASGGRVRINLESDSQQVTLCVQDSKPGVPPAEREQLFEPLYRAESSRNRRHGGSGLGLSICRSIVQAHHGRIEASQSDDGGLAVLIVLPIRET